ncbi:hypothetical protein A9G15_04170 [Gilliamella apis]|uniref:hypothetical protein n=1 Tax=Gilliamella apis TaxID=1970738 RepID=UPI00080DA0FA|nr:hypothetical protein [Gilliamella apis]OCG04302.1 hypothetical protein A9G15_04170 [Gilliamella apis]
MVSVYISMANYCEVIPQPDSNQIDERFHACLLESGSVQNNFITCQGKNCSELATNKVVVKKSNNVSNLDKNHYIALCCSNCRKKLSPSLPASNNFVFKQDSEVCIYQNINGW